MVVSGADPVPSSTASPRDMAMSSRSSSSGSIPDTLALGFTNWQREHTTMRAKAARVHGNPKQYPCNKHETLTGFN
jgi:hypothetical protein